MVIENEKKKSGLEIHAGINLPGRPDDQRNHEHQEAKVTTCSQPFMHRAFSELCARWPGRVRRPTRSPCGR